jgi:hypothetical protein
LKKLEIFLSNSLSFLSKKNPWTTVLNFIDFRDKKNALIVLKLENIYIPPNNLLITTKREENTYIPLK